MRSPHARINLKEYLKINTNYKENLDQLRQRFDEVDFNEISEEVREKTKDDLTILIPAYPGLQSQAGKIACEGLYSNHISLESFPDLEKECQKRGKLRLSSDEITAIIINHVRENLAKEIENNPQLKGKNIKNLNIIFFTGLNPIGITPLLPVVDVDTAGLPVTVKPFVGNDILKINTAINRNATAGVPLTQDALNQSEILGMNSDKFASFLHLTVASIITPLKQAGIISDKAKCCVANTACAAGAKIESGVPALKTSSETFADKVVRGIGNYPTETPLSKQLEITKDELKEIRQMNIEYLFNKTLHLYPAAPEDIASAITDSKRRSLLGLKDVLNMVTFAGPGNWPHGGIGYLQTWQEGQNGTARAEDFSRKINGEFIEGMEKIYGLAPKEYPCPPQDDKFVTLKTKTLNLMSENSLEAHTSTVQSGKERSDYLQL